MEIKTFIKKNHFLYIRIFLFYLCDTDDSISSCILDVKYSTVVF